MLLLACILAGSSCTTKNKQNNDVQMATATDSVAVNTPQRMQVSVVESSFNFKGKAGKSVVKRVPDDKLPIVVNEEGEKFVDNSISLQVTLGGKQIASRTFTKDDFAAHVDQRFLKHAILEGLVYDQVTPQGIIYAASLSYPQSDLYIPLRLTMSADGKITVTKNDLMDDYVPAGQEGTRQN